MSTIPMAGPESIAPTPEFVSMLGETMLTMYDRLDECVQMMPTPSSHEERVAFEHLVDFIKDTKILCDSIREQTRSVLLGGDAGLNTLFSLVCKFAEVIDDNFSHLEHLLFGEQSRLEDRKTDIATVDDMINCTALLFYRSIRIDAHLNGTSVDEELASVFQEAGIDKDELEKLINDKGLLEVCLGMFVGGMLEAADDREKRSTEHTSSITRVDEI